MRFTLNPFTTKLDVVSLTGSGAPAIETVAGNDGTPVGPDASFVLHLVGNNSTGLNVSGNVGLNTLTISGLPSSPTQIGTTAYATNAKAAAQTANNVALTPSNITSMFSTSPVPSSQGGTGLSSPTAHSLIVAEGASPFVALGVASNGQLPIGSTGANPVLATITAGNGITVTNGAGSISIASTANFMTVTSVANSASPYTVLSTDQFIAADSTSGVVSILLPNAPTTGRVLVIKDSKGQTVTNAISITTVGGTVTLDGQTTYTLSSNYQSINVIFDGSNYEIF